MTCLTRLVAASSGAAVVLAASAVAAQDQTATGRPDGKDGCMEILAHRGASGYLPEHTLPAYALAYGQGAGWIEPDVVLTADGVAIALHDITLDRTTDVAERYPDRARADGRYYAADFTYAEIERLRVVEALPDRYPHRTFRVPRLADVLELVDGLNRTTGRRVGVYPELKSPGVQPDLARTLLAELAGYEWPIRVQSFDDEALAALDTELPRVQLIARPDQLTPAGLNRIASYAIGIGVPKELVFQDAAVVGQAHDLGLQVHAYTLRADRLDAAFDSLAGEVAALIEAGVDAVFTDHPDQVLALVARSCDATR